MKTLVLVLCLFLSPALTNASHVTVTVWPGVHAYDTNEAGKLSIWGTGSQGCEVLRADPTTGTVSRVVTLHWENKLVKAQELGRSIPVIHDSCRILDIGSMSQ